MTTSAALHALSAWIDQGNAHRDAEAITWGRLAKVAEECGEVIQAFIGATGQNPRKGITGTGYEVQEELLDVALTALCAVAHLNNNDGTDLLALFADKVQRVAVRADLNDSTAQASGGGVNAEVGPAKDAHQGRPLSPSGVPAPPPAPAGAS